MKKRPKPTKFTPKNPHKYIGDISNIVMRSKWERKFALWCDNNVNVLKWNSEGIPIPYYSYVDGKMRRYFIDFFCEVRKVDGSIEKLAIEVKPFNETQPPKPPRIKSTKSEERYIDELMTFQRNQDKWKSAREWCQNNDFKFVILTEHELGIKK